jgi:hypothetical protein
VQAIGGPVTLLDDELLPPATDVSGQRGQALGAGVLLEVHRDMQVQMPAVPPVGDLDRADGPGDRELLAQPDPRPTGDDGAEPVGDDGQQRREPHPEVVRHGQSDHVDATASEIPGCGGRGYLLSAGVADLRGTDRARPNRPARFQAGVVADPSVVSDRHGAPADRPLPASADVLQP